MKKFLFSMMIVLANFVFAYGDDSSLSKPGFLDEEEIFTKTSLSAYKNIVVKDFTTAGAEFENLDAEEKADVEAIKPQLVKNLTESMVVQLKKEGKFANVLANRSAGGSTIIVKGKFTKFNGGVGAAKFFLGFMAPKSAKTNISFSGQLVDARTGKVLASFKDIRSGGEGGSLGRIRGVMPVQAKDEGEEIANFINKLAN